MSDGRPLDDMFMQQPLSDGRVRKYELMYVPANQALPTTGDNPTELNIIATGAGMDSFALLERAFILVEYNLMNADKTTPSPTKNHTIQNGWSLFDRAGLYLSDREIEQVENCSMVSHLKRLVEHTNESILGQGSSARYYPQVDQLATVISDTEVNDANLAKGVVYHAGTKSKFARLYLRDIFGFCNIDKAILGANVKLRLFPQQNHLKSIYGEAASTAAFIRLINVGLYLPTMRPDNGTLEAIYNSVKAEKTIPFQFEHWNYNSVPIALVNGSTKVNYVVPNASKRVSAVVAYVQPNEASATPTLISDKLAGGLYGLSTHSVLIDGKSFPENGAEGSLRGYVKNMRPFFNLATSTNKMFSELSLIAINSIVTQ